MIAEIVGPSGRVHYRRPPDDPLVEEAKRTPGYSVRLLQECPVCEGSGFSGYGTGYDDVCSECGGQQYALANLPAHV